MATGVQRRSELRQVQVLDHVRVKYSDHRDGHGDGWGPVVYVVFAGRRQGAGGKDERNNRVELVFFARPAELARTDQHTDQQAPVPLQNGSAGINWN